MKPTKMNNQQPFNRTETCSDSPLPQFQSDKKSDTHNMDGPHVEKIIQKVNQTHPEHYDTKKCDYGSGILNDLAKEASTRSDSSSSQVTVHPLLPLDPQEIEALAKHYENDNDFPDSKRTNAASIERSFHILAATVDIKQIIKSTRLSTSC